MKQDGTVGGIKAWLKKNAFLRWMKYVSKAFAYYLYNHLVTKIPFYTVRHFYLQYLLGIKIGKKTAIHMGCFFTGNNIAFGSNTVVNRNCYFDGRVGLEIGSNVSISPECYLLSLSHDVNSKTFETTGGLVRIEDNCWLGARVMILPHVTLHKGSVVGAGSVVTKSVPSFTVVGGIPARKIADRSQDIAYTLSYFPFFDTDIN
jgi:acetyltransferase-like isoleucine patch superfamily enzyme